MGVKASLGLALYPGPSVGGGGRAWYTLHAHAPGAPEISGGIAYYRLPLRFTRIVYFTRLFASIPDYYVSERNNTQLRRVKGQLRTSLAPQYREDGLSFR